jgi:hypothetical protein
MVISDLNGRMKGMLEGMSRVHVVFDALKITLTLLDLGTTFGFLCCPSYN